MSARLFQSDQPFLVPSGACFAPSGSISILGMGNLQLGDYGAGLYLIGLLKSRYQFPDEVDVEDIGTPGIDLIPRLSGVDLLILVDTIWADAPAGTVRLYNSDDLDRGKTAPRIRPQDPALAHALRVLDLAGCAPTEVMLVGIVPSPTGFGPGLSPEVEDGVEQAITYITAELRSRGIGIQKRKRHTTALAS